MPDPGFAATLMTMTVMAIPISAIVTSHLRKMAEIKARSGNLNTQAVNEDVRIQLAAMREEIASLRDTTTKFDMSFDAAISRLEQRVDHIEAENATTETATTASPLRRGSPAQTDTEQVTVLGRKG